MPRDDSSGARAGTTLVEVLVGAVLIGILAVAGVSYMSHAGAESGNQRHRRVALDVATARMEELRAARYDQIKPPSTGYAVWYIRPVGAGWSFSANDPYETTNLNQRTLSIASTVAYRDIDGGAATYDELVLSVAVSPGAGVTNTIVLESRRAPF